MNNGYYEHMPVSVADAGLTMHDRQGCGHRHGTLEQAAYCLIESQAKDRYIVHVPFRTPGGRGQREVLKGRPYMITKMLDGTVIEQADIDGGVTWPTMEAQAFNALMKKNGIGLRKTVEYHDLVALAEAAC